MAIARTHRGEIPQSLTCNRWLRRIEDVRTPPGGGNAGRRVMDEPGSLLRAILEHTGWTQARLVHELRQTAQLLREPAPAGLNVVTVNRWKQGRQSPSVYYRRLIRHLYVSTHQSAVGSDEVDSMKRRQFLAYSTFMTGTAALDPARMTPAPQRLGFDGRL